MATMILFMRSSFSSAKTWLISSAYRFWTYATGARAAAADGADPTLGTAGLRALPRMRVSRANPPPGRARPDAGNPGTTQWSLEWAAAPLPSAAGGPGSSEEQMLT
jgi:hypothetical protein